MKSYVFILLFILRFLPLHSQKTEVLHQSGFKHDYALSALKYIEDLRDTNRLNYVATLRISGVQDYYLAVASWHDLIKIKAKELGANSFIVSSFKEDDHSVELITRLFFAGERFLKLNALKREYLQCPRF